MNTSDRQVVFLKNAFDPTEKDIREVSPDLTYREIYNIFAANYDIENAIIIDLDYTVTSDNYDSIPRNEHIYIKLIPAGGASNEELGWGGIIAGSLMTAAGIALIATGVGAAPGAALIGAGVGMVIGGITMLNMPDFSLDADNNSSMSTQKSSIQGAKNQVRKGGRIPILLGKHRIVPDTAALPYTTINVDSDQFIHQLFCAGYSNIAVDTNTYKIGDTRLISDNFYYALELHQNDNANFWLYPARVITTPVATLLEFSEEKFVTTPYNTRQIAVYFTFPSGLVKYDNDGDRKKRGVTLGIRWRKHSDDPWPGPSGKWGLDGYTLLSYEEHSNETVRKVYLISLNNLSETDPDYCPNRQYDIGVIRLTNDANSLKIIDKVYFDIFQSITASFITNVSYNSNPVNVSDNLTLLSLLVQASGTVNGTIDEFNFIGQSQCPVYSGVGTGSTSWTTVAATSNPAAIFLYVIRSAELNKKPATSDQINWASFEAWYSYCVSKGFQCNTHIKTDVSLSELLNNIAMTGRATWSIVNGKYYVVADKEQTNIIQYFTPRNSWDFIGTKNFSDKPTALRIKFIDANLDYIEAERFVFYDEESYDYVQDVTLFGCTDANLAYIHGRYQLACMYLRPEVFTFSADIEHIVCTRWDRIAYANDVILTGLYFGRIKTLRYLESGYVEGVEIDERIVYEPGKTYSITVRCSDGTSVTHIVENFAGGETNIETDEIIFLVPVATSPIAVDDLCLFGISSTVYTDLIVTGIEPDSEYSAKITCVPYDENIYLADSQEIPEYDVSISKRGDLSGAVQVGIPTTAADLAIAAMNQGSESSSKEFSLSAITDTSVAISDSSFSPYFPYFSGSYNKLFYTDGDDGCIYYKNGDDALEGSIFIDEEGIMFCDGIYVGVRTGYIYDINKALVVESEAWCPQADENSNIYYINVDDGKIYKYDAVLETSAAVTSYGLKHFWIHYYSTESLIIWDDGTLSGSGIEGLILISTTDGSYISTIIEGTGEVLSFQMFDDDTLVYHTSSFAICKVDISAATIIFYLFNTIFFDSYNGSVYFMTFYDYLLRSELSVEAARLSTQPYFKTAECIITISGDITSGSNSITNVSSGSMKKVEIGETIEHEYLPAGSYVLSKDTANSRLIISANATGTKTDADITVTSSRMLLDANLAIAPASITHAEIASSAILSSHIANNAIEETKIASSAITGDKIASGAITTSKLATNAVTTAKIYDGSVTASKLADDAVTMDKIDNTYVEATTHVGFSVTPGALRTFVVYYPVYVVLAITANSDCGLEVWTTENFTIGSSMRDAGLNVDWKWSGLLLPGTYKAVASTLTGNVYFIKAYGCANITDAYSYS